MDGLDALTDVEMIQSTLQGDLQIVRGYVLHNIDPQPFIWTATAEQILEKVRRGRRLTPRAGLRSRWLSDVG